MPIYEYECIVCEDHVEEIIWSLEERHVELSMYCPVCEDYQSFELIMSAGSFKIDV